MVPMRALFLHVGPIFTLAVVLGGNSEALAQSTPRHLISNPSPNPVPHTANEPMAEVFSQAKSAKYLDTVARFWMIDSCGACHANFSYLMARPALGELHDSAVAETRRFLENRLALSKMQLKNPRSAETRFQSESVGIAVGLAFHDALTTAKLQPTTRQALDHMWELQKKDGARAGTWSCGCGEFPLVELDAYYVATLAALAAGVAPDGYAQSASAKDGITRLRRYLTKNDAPHLHHKAMLLWASLHLDGLMTSTERTATVQALLAKQRPDGGWSLASLIGQAGRVSDASDGYGTGFVLYVLRQAGVATSRTEIKQAVQWLKSNQRASGGWFTPEERAGHQPEGGHGTRELGILNATASFAVMALRACDAIERPRASIANDPAQRRPGLALRHRMQDGI
jgi:squalene-hopene/tetraprenyl-beta-curcumene cyclase